MDWKYAQPVEIRFQTGGALRIQELLRDVGYKNGVLVCDPYFKSNGLAEKVIDASGGKIKACFHNITPNPLVSEVDACAKLMRETKADFTVALGGGSAMDCAKAACAVALTTDSISLYHTGGGKIGHEVLPLIAVPTTAGTGSEVTCVSVITDQSTGFKGPVFSEKLYPKIALIDPELTYSIPKHITASTGLDVLSHAIEAYWSIQHQPICDALAINAAKLVFEHLFTAYEDGGNIVAREKICEASVIAGLAFTLPKTAASHACSFALTNMYHMPHGEACAFTLDLLCEINAEAENGRLHKFAKELGFKDAYTLGTEIRELKKKMNMKITLSDAGIDIKDIDLLAQKCMHPNMLNNPVKLNEEDIKKMFLKLQ